MVARYLDSAVDGRRLRGGRTRRKLVDAYLELVEAGDHRPRAASVAERAGVSLRTLYHHYDHLADLAADALRSGSTRQLEAMADVRSEGSLARRVESLARTRGELFDAAAGLGHGSVAVGQPTRSLESVRASRSVLRRQIERTFEGELAGVDGRDAGSRALLDAVDAVASADAWAYLRGELGRSSAESCAIVAMVLTSLLTPPAAARRRATSG